MCRVLIHLEKVSKGKGGQNYGTTTKACMVRSGDGGVWVIAIVVVFIVKGGVSTYSEDTGFRLIMAGLLIGGLLAYLILMNLTLRKPGQVDERDKLIMRRAPVVQLWAVIFSLAAWMIALTESYWDEGQIPVIFPYLILLSTLIVSTLAQSLGILIGYWRGVSR